MLCVFLLAFLLLAGCSSTKKSYSEKRGLMLLENTQMSRNKALYSKHNRQTQKAAYKKFKKNNRYFRR